MPPESRQYTLVGFAVELDWRPLSFVKPIPAYRVCCVCGLVRRRTAFLQCTHTLCQSCYEQCAQDGARVCPLDGHRCDEEDVELNDCPVEELLKRKVECWNKESDCGEVLPASEIAHHFHRECRYHSISCPKCSAAVLCSNAVSILGRSTAPLRRLLDPSAKGKPTAGTMQLSWHRSREASKDGRMKLERSLSGWSLEAAQTVTDSVKFLTESTTAKMHCEKCGEASTL
ncbi:uncharacterized protein LOC144133060 isoform X2 [Amblyomma americanum]